MGRLVDRLREKGLIPPRVDPDPEVIERYSALLRELVEMEDEVARRYRLFAAVVLDEVVPETADPFYRDLVKDIRARAKLDRQENVLYVFWMRERLTKGPIDLELEEFSEVVAGRALVRLLHYVPRGLELLRSIDPTDDSWLPDPRDVRRFVLSGGLAEEDGQKFLARLFSEVPKSRRALFKLLGAYKVVVEAEAERSGSSAGLLPGQELRRRTAVSWDQLARLLGVGPQDWEKEVDEARRIERAVELYQIGVTVEEAAKSAGVGRDLLTGVLRDRGLLRKPGRPRRYRSIGDLVLEEGEQEDPGDEPGSDSQVASEGSRDRRSL